MTLLAKKFVQIASKIDATNAQMAALQAKRARDPRRGIAEIRAK